MRDGPEDPPIDASFGRSNIGKVMQKPFFFGVQHFQMAGLGGREML